MFIWEAFYRWRTLDQHLNHGMSNMSEILNKEYNEKRWELIQITHNHLVEHPDDIWAWAQRFSLMVFPNIERGEPCGNSNIRHWGYLYTDIIEEDVDNNNEGE